MSLTHSYNWREMREKKAFLAFEDGTVMRGHSVGAKVDNVGEVVFNNGPLRISGNPERSVIRGQFVTMTYPR
jgi:carbamoyl-phosphate synthase small subunit